MKSFLHFAAAAALTLSALQANAEGSVPRREHRAIWMSPYLSNAWPSSAITAANASTHKSIITKRLDKFKDQNINILYYHARAMCDATYNSAYEPWSSQLTGTRGAEPAFDPFGFLVEEAHKRGIEVYAWLNPYRYSNSTGSVSYGAGERNYENSNPDWLLVNSKQTVLNPGRPEVVQRIVDVVNDILSKYDVDGIVFDDYFYGQGGTDMSADANLWQAYRNGGGTLSQADWRRANINGMVSRVKDAIKAAKPWVAFGISPAGVASPPNVTSEYGLPAYTGSGDWQYNQIYSDPLAWLKAGTIDFISPQIYWPTQFDNLSGWWQRAAGKYGRHCYPSVDLSDIVTVKTAEIMREVEQTRTNSPAGASGIVYFEYGKFVNSYENVFGTNRELGVNLQQGVYPTKALTPLRGWDKASQPSMTANVRVDNGTLTWDAVDNARYTVYAKPTSANTPFTPSSEWLQGISYTNSYTLPAAYADSEWYVAVYDRYGNESAPLGVGAVAGQPLKVSLTYPEDGAQPVDLFRFRWSETGPALHTLEVSESADFATLHGSVDVTASEVYVSMLPALTAGKTYYWRVRTVPVNAPASVSESRSFVAPKIAITSFADQEKGVAPDGTVSWSAAIDGADYLLEISNTETFASIEYSTTVHNATSVKLPAAALMSGRNYVARVTASYNGASSQSAPVRFTTLDRTDYTAPVLANPAADGTTMHTNQSIQLAEWQPGIASMLVYLSASNTFPTRTSLTLTLRGGATATDSLGSLKLSSKNLVDGTTYYVRSRASYYLSSSTAMQYTDYSPVRSFVYSATAGVDNIQADAANIYIANGTLYAPAGTPVKVYTTDGRLVLAGSGNTSLPTAPGVYLVRAASHTLRYAAR